MIWARGHSVRVSPIVLLARDVISSLDRKKRQDNKFKKGSSVAEMFVTYVSHPPIFKKRTIRKNRRMSVS